MAEAKDKKGFWRRLFRSDAQPDADAPAAPQPEESAAAAPSGERDAAAEQGDAPVPQEPAAPHKAHGAAPGYSPGLQPAEATRDRSEEEERPETAAPTAEEPEPQSLAALVEQSAPQEAPTLKRHGAEPAGTEKAPGPASEGPSPEAAASEGWYTRLRSGLSRSSRELSGSITGIFTKRRLDEAMLEELEDALIQADLGLDMAERITQALRRDRFAKQVTPEEVRAILAREVERVLDPVEAPLDIDFTKKPFVVLVVGVNGTGKTTTIGKIAAHLKANGRSVMLAAGDTFRAAAIEQLKIWGGRTDAPVVARETGADAAGLSYDALARAKAEGRDVLLIDTAGRLQNKTELMAELEKIIRVLKKQDDSAPHAVLLVLDATTGQNALNQVETFQRVVGVTGLVMTKLDGTAKGGILVAIAGKHALPVHFVGVGEGVDDLQPFDAAAFARAIAGADARAEA
jgi:fused signal recognition particle receptor